MVKVTIWAEYPAFRSSCGIVGISFGNPATEPGNMAKGNPVELRLSMTAMRRWMFCNAIQRFAIPCAGMQFGVKRFSILRPEYEPLANLCLLHSVQSSGQLWWQWCLWFNQSHWNKNWVTKLPWRCTSWLDVMTLKLDALSSELVKPCHWHNNDNDVVDDGGDCKERVTTRVLVSPHFPHYSWSRPIQRRRPAQKPGWVDFLCQSLVPLLFYCCLLLPHYYY